MRPIFAAFRELIEFLDFIVQVMRDISRLFFVKAHDF